jgi:tetratricopeptide (TPR) repeat protein
MKDTIWYQIPMADAQFYDAWARSIAAGNFIGDKVFLMNPGYPYILGLIYTVFGHSILSVIILQFFIGTLNCALIYKIAEKIFNKPVALISGLAASVYGISLLYEGFLLTAAFIVFFNLLATLFLLKTVDKPSFLYYFLAGIFLGISAVLRPNILLVVPVLLVWLFFRNRRLSSFSGILLPIFIILFSVALRNYLVGHRFVLTTMSAGMNFYIGNNPSADGAYTPSFFEDANPKNQQESYRFEASKKTGRELDLSEASRYWTGQAFGFITGQPFSWVALLGKKFMLFLNNLEIPTNINYYFVKKRSFFARLPLLNFGMILPFGLMGIIVISSKSAPRAGPRPSIEILFLFVLTYLFALLIFFVGSEYRYPVVPYFIIFGAYGAYETYKKFAGKDYRKGAVFLFIILVSAVMSNVNIYQTEEVTSHNNLGVIYLKLNRADEALSEFQKALKLDPRYIDTYNNLGGVYNLKGDYERAVRFFRRAILLNPGYVEAYNNLANTYFKKELWDAAIELFRKAIAVNPNYANAYYGLGVAYNNKKMPDKAISYFEKAIKLDPLFSIAYFELGNIYIDKGMLDEAVYFFKKSVEIDPMFIAAYNNLGVLYFGKEMYREALEEFGHALKIHPDSPDVLNNYKKTIEKLQDK